MTSKSEELEQKSIAACLINAMFSTHLSPPTNIMIPKSPLGRLGAYAIAVLSLTISIAQAAIYTDSTGEINSGISTGGGTLDIVSMEVTDNATDVVFALKVNGNITTTDWGNFMIGISTGSTTNTNTGNGWSRPINLNTASTGGMTRWIGSWVNGAGGAQLWTYTGSGTNGGTSNNWLSNSVGSVGLTRTPGSQSTITYAVSKTSLGVNTGDTISFDAFSSGGGGGDSAVDSLANPTTSITSWGQAYVSQPPNIRQYTLSFNNADTDADGLPDAWETQYFPNLAQGAGDDPDNDGLTNAQEFARGTQPNDNDSDDDLLLDGVETSTGVFVNSSDTGTNPLVADTDGDAVSDGAEVSAGRNPNKFNYSQITVAGSFQGPGDWHPEPFPTVNPLNVMSGVAGDEFGWQLDLNFSGAANYQGKFATGSWSQNWGTSQTPGVLQSGGFGNDIPFATTASGIWRFYFNTDTLAYTFTRATFASYADFATAYGLTGTSADDDDGDSLTNQQEFAANTDPNNFDTDADGLSDGSEVDGSAATPTLGVTLPTSPFLADTDGDGLPDGWEVTYYLDPTDNGTVVAYTNYIDPAFGLTITANPNGGLSNPDGDALTNAQEYATSNNPLVAEGNIVSPYAKMVVAGSFVPTKPDGAWDEEGNPSNTMQLVANFTWNLVVYVPAVPTSPAFKFTTGSWATNWGDNAPANGVADPNGADISVAAFTAPGYYLVSFNDFSLAYSIAALAAADLDADGLPDAYEVYYGRQLPSPTANLNPATDYDGDGQTTAQEFAAGTNPVKDVVAPAISFVPGVQTLTWYPLNATIPTPTAADVVATDDITPSPVVDILSPAPDNSVPGLNSIAYRATDAAGNYRLLYRVVAVGDVPPTYYNLQSPQSLGVSTVNSGSVYAQVFLAGATPGAGAAPAIQCWIGVNSTNSDPSSWSESAWKVATPNASATGSNDEYTVSLSGADYAPGTYYYAARWQLGSGAYVYGGIAASGGGAWGAEATASPLTTYDSGVLTVTQGFLRDVTFSVDMNPKILKGTFSAASHGVEVRGTFNGFTGGTSILADSDMDGVYTGTFAVQGTPGSTEEFKFYATGPSGLEWEAFPSNRSFILGAANTPQALSTAFFSNDDGIGPVITLTGAETINLNVGDTFTDPGSSAFDAFDGIRTVVVGGSVNTAIANTYNLTYDASDASGNAGIQRQRTVVVSGGNPFNQWATDNGLTGDDALPGSDPDKDGFTNTQEFAFGGNPTSASPSLLTIIKSSATLSLTWLQRTDGAATYQVQSSPSLSIAFAPDASVTIEDAANQDNVPAGHIRKQVSTTTSGARKFFQISAVATTGS
jgi:hypothetical protein